MVRLLHAKSHLLYFLWYTFATVLCKAYTANRLYQRGEYRSGFGFPRRPRISA